METEHSTKRELLQAEVERYIELKFGRKAFKKPLHDTNRDPLYFEVRGIEESMWQFVVKPELEHLAEKYCYYVMVHAEKPSYGWLKFEFKKQPAIIARRNVESPLTYTELKTLRQMIKGWKK